MEYEKLVEVFDDQYMTDDEKWERKGSRLVDIYTSADQDGKQVMNKVLMALCGWTFPTLIAMTKEDKEEGHEQTEIL